MFISIDGHTYQISDEGERGFTNLLAGTMEAFLTKIPATYKIMGDQVARKMLYDKEKEAIKQGFPKEQAALLRPSRDESPIYKLMNIALNQGIHDAMKDFTLTLTTSGDFIKEISYE